MLTALCRVAYVALGPLAGVIVKRRSSFSSAPDPLATSYFHTRRS